MFKNKPLAFKFSIAILSGVLLVFFLILIYNYTVSRKLILKNVEENTKNLTSSAINKSEGFFKVIEKITQNVGFLLSDTKKTAPEINSILSDIVKNNEEIYGSCMAYGPYQFKSNIKYYAPYYYKKGNSILYENLANAGYFYPDWDWYKIPVTMEKPLWSEPYYDKGGGNELMTTYSVPIYIGSKSPDSVLGVLTADVSLEWLQEVVSRIKIFETGFAFLISQKGTMITHPDTNYVMRESIFSLSEKLNDPDLKKIGQEMVAGHTDFVPVNSGFHKSKSWIYYTHLENNDWSLGFVFPENELYEDLYQLNRILIFIVIAGLFLLFLLIVFISKRITRPLQNLAKLTEAFGKGNFEISIPPRISNDEVGSLQKSFLLMQSELKEYTENLKITTAAKEKIESELKIAREIQMGMIPRIFPAFPERDEIDIFGYIEPAREVGGDLYDFFFIDDHRMCFAIGDVAGKGTPAALYMAITMTILRTEIQIPGISLNQVVESMNDHLCKNNEGNLFVTLFIGILNTQTGDVEYINAGHNYPFIVKNNGEVSELNKTHCIPLGIQKGTCVKAGTITLEKDDSILMYTDGINEAFNAEFRQYSVGRIREIIKNTANLPPHQTVKLLVDDVKLFTVNAEQSDDMSVLSIKFNGNAATGNKKVAFKIKNIPESLIFIADEISKFSILYNIPDTTAKKMNLVTEELVLNIINYGYTDNRQHEIELEFAIGQDAVTLMVADDGYEFNPLETNEVDTSLGVDERKIGGLGIHLVKNLTNSFTYKREGTKNYTSIQILY